jgi:xylose isomerase
MINDGGYKDFLSQRYKLWSQKTDIMQSLSLEDMHQKVINENINPEPKSGRQEYLENLLNTFID